MVGWITLRHVKERERKRRHSGSWMLNGFTPSWKLVPAVLVVVNDVGRWFIHILRNDARQHPMRDSTGNTFTHSNPIRSWNRPSIRVVSFIIHFIRIADQRIMVRNTICHYRSILEVQNIIPSLVKWKNISNVKEAWAIPSVAVMSLQMPLTSPNPASMINCFATPTLINQPRRLHRQTRASASHAVACDQSSGIRFYPPWYGFCGPNTRMRIQ